MSQDSPETDSIFTLLLVDDDHDVLAANARFLRLQGIQVVLADNADTALQRLESERVDAIVTDLCMPERSGLEFAAEARWVTNIQIGSSGANYAMWMDAPSVQHASGGPEDLTNARRFGSSFDWQASLNASAGYDVAMSVAAPAHIGPALAPVGPRRGRALRALGSR